MNIILLGFLPFLLFQQVNSFFYNIKKISLPLFSIPVREPSSSFYRKYPLSRNYHEHYLKRLNSKNATIQTREIVNGAPLMNFDENDNEYDKDGKVYSIPKMDQTESGFRVVLSKQMFDQFFQDIADNFEDAAKEDEEGGEEEEEEDE